MPTFIRLPEELLDALDALGIGDARRTVRRVVIDLPVGEIPIVHVEHIGDERIIAVVRALEGVEVRREPAPETFTIDNSLHTGDPSARSVITEDDLRAAGHD